MADSTEQDSLLERLERLETAHQLLLRYARDLKDAYEAERERRARLSQSTLELATLLAATLTDPE